MAAASVPTYPAVPVSYAPLFYLRLGDSPSAAATGSAADSSGNKPARHLQHEHIASSAASIMSTPMGDDTEYQQLRILHDQHRTVFRTRCSERQYCSSSGIPAGNQDGSQDWRVLTGPFIGTRHDQLGAPG